MLTPETLAAACRVAQYGARTAMLAARAATDDPDRSKTPVTDPAQADERQRPESRLAGGEAAEETATA